MVATGPQKPEPHGASPQQTTSRHLHTRSAGIALCGHCRQQAYVCESRGKRQGRGLRLHLSVCVLVAQSCPTPCDPMDDSPPGSSVHGILQARILEWVAISFSRDLPDPGVKPRSPTLQADSLPFKLPRKPLILVGTAINTGCWAHGFLRSFSQSCR